MITAQKRVDKTAREAMSTVTAVQKDVKAARKAETEVRKKKVLDLSVLAIKLYPLYEPVYTFITAYTPMYTRLYRAYTSYIHLTHL